MPTGHYDHTSQRVNLVGKTIGYARVDSLHHFKPEGGSFWNCTCLYNGCGKKYVRSTAALMKHAEDANCGCYCRIKAAEGTRNSSKSIRQLPHGKRIQEILHGMKQRCHNKKSHSYKNYGGKGIFVCDEWRNSYHAFYEWSMENGYADNLTIDRIDNNDGYYPDNCRWVTIKDQCNNKSQNRIIEYKGKKYTVAELSRELKMNYNTLLRRVKSDTFDKPLDAPIMNCGKRYNVQIITESPDRG